MAAEGMIDTKLVSSETSAVWGNHIPVPDTPDGFTVRTTYPTNTDGVEVIGALGGGYGRAATFTSRRCMTVVVEGKMAIQFYTKEAGALVPDGECIILSKGDTGYVKADRIHDAKYIDNCKLVYVHDKAFAFVPHS